MAAIPGKTYPDLYAAIGVHSGPAPGSASDAFSGFMAMRGPVGIGQALSVKGSPGSMPRMIVFHKSADTTVHPSNAGRIVAYDERWHGKLPQPRMRHWARFGPTRDGSDVVAPTRVEVVSDAGSPFQLALARMLAAVATAAIMSGFVFVDLLDRGDPARLCRGRDKSGTF